MRVTSKNRPKSPSQISVLPLGNRCAFEILGLKKSLSLFSWYFQTICLVAKSTSIMRENGIVWSKRCGPLSKRSKLPLGSGVGACWPLNGGAPSFQIILPVFRSMMMTVEMLRKLKTMSPFGSSATPLP